MHINQLINPASLEHDIAMGFIRVQTHPSLPLKIYNYTEKAQFARHWNIATLACRGLIVRDSGEVVARPFGKFFNWDEQPPKGKRFKMDLDEPVVVTDKIDGSMGVLYPTGLGGWQFATRGSFTSDQARHANVVWDQRYRNEFEYRINPRLTYLFEIVYPENRIVVDYKGMDDLVLLGAVDIDGGFVYGPEMIPGWPGPSAKVFPYQTLREAVGTKPRAGKEGFVVRSLVDGLMVKVKYEDYVSLHRIVTGLNEKEIWRRAMKADLENGPEIDKMELVLRDIPDELHEWAIAVTQSLTTQIRLKSLEAQAVYQGSRPSGPVFHDDVFVRDHRKRFALRIKDRESWLQKTLWILFDGNDPREFLWKLVEPRGDARP